MVFKIVARRLIVSDSIHEMVRQRAAFALGRFESRIARVTVRFSDLNGPRGGLDKRCLIEAKLRPTGMVVADVSDSDIEHAVGRAIQRLARAVQTHLERSRLARRDRPGSSGSSSE